MSTQENDSHLIPLPDLERRLETDFENGLSTAEAKERIKKFGLNAMPI